MFGCWSRLIKRGISNLVDKNVSKTRSAIKLRKKLSDVRQTAGQAQELKKFVKQNKKEQIAAKIQQTANYDKEYREFINEFNKKHKGKINVLDLSNYSRKYRDLSEPGLSKQDLAILEEFRKRRLQQKASQFMEIRTADDDSSDAGLEESQLYESSDRIYTSSTEGEGIEQGEQDESVGDIIEQYSHESEKDSESQEEDDGYGLQETIFTGDEKDQHTQTKQGLFQIEDEFIILMLDRDTVTKVTTLNRIMKHRALVFMANSNGVISYGRGKATGPADALTNAIVNAKKNLIAIKLDYSLTVPQFIRQRFQDYQLTIRPRTYFNPWGHPVMATILSITGAVHCSFKTVHTDTNNYTMLNSYFKAITKNQTPRIIAQRKGFKVYRHQWVKPVEMKNKPQVALVK